MTTGNIINMPKSEPEQESGLYLFHGNKPLVAEPESRKIDDSKKVWYFISFSASLTFVAVSTAVAVILIKQPPDLIRPILPPAKASIITPIPDEAVFREFEHKIQTPPQAVVAAPTIPPVKQHHYHRLPPKQHHHYGTSSEEAETVRLNHQQL